MKKPKAKPPLVDAVEAITIPQYEVCEACGHKGPGVISVETSEGNKPICRACTYILTRSPQ